MSESVMVALPTAFFPSIAYMRALLQYPAAEVYVGEPYRKQTYRNRTELLSPQGREVLSLPVERYPYPPPATAEIRLSEHGAWREKHLRAIETDYGSAPFFSHYIDEIKELFVLREEGEPLILFNHRCLAFLCRELEIPLPLLTTTLCEGALFLSSLCDRVAPHSTQPLRRYWQVYEEKWGFTPHLSALDLLLNIGPEAILYLHSSHI